MKIRTCIVFALLLSGFAARAANPNLNGSSPPETIILDLSAPQKTIPDDFLGLSFESNQLLAGRDGQHEFSPDNLPLQTLLQTLQIKNLRFGGNLADSATSPDPRISDAKPMFQLARKIGARVIYTVRFTTGGSRRPFACADAHAAGKLCHELLSEFPDGLSAFTIGNEPDMYFRLLEKAKGSAKGYFVSKSDFDRHAYQRYWEAWQDYAAIILAENPTALFNGPSSTGRPAWAQWFGENCAGDPQVAFISNHYYPGGNGKTGRPEEQLEAMLSPGWHQLYERYLMANGVPNPARHPFRIEEGNSFYAGGAPNVSDAFAAALWAADFAHWLAAHGCAGINFHTGTHGKATGKYLDYSAFVRLTPESSGESESRRSPGYHVLPVGYGLLLFSLGSQGSVVPTVPDQTNSFLCAYAVATPDGHLKLTVINKNKNPEAAPAMIRMNLHGAKLESRGQYITLTAPHSNVWAKTGITLGGAAISENGTWSGKWTSLPPSAFLGDDVITLTVPPASAQVIQLKLRKNDVNLPFTGGNSRYALSFRERAPGSLRRGPSVPHF